MTELGHLSPLPAAASLPAAFPARSGRGRAAGLVIVWGIVLANAGVIVWLWVHGGNLTDKTTGELPTGVARITGLPTSPTATCTCAGRRR